MFKRGVHTGVYDNHGDNPVERLKEQFALVPLTAKKKRRLGETIANGLADHLQEADVGNHHSQTTQKALIS
jgi:hypothetical protein